MASFGGQQFYKNLFLETMSVQETLVSWPTMLVKERPLNAGKRLLVGPDSFLSAATCSHNS